jgi:pimeloyl-ACP methyl ester carboxylesterase
VHFIMQRKQLLGIARRAEAAVPQQSAFRTPEGETAFLAAYDVAMKRWPISYEEMDLRSRFGTTHVVACGPSDARPLVLLHGYMATLTMWAPNVADFSNHYRVYALDVMGQPGKSIPAEPIRSASDYVEWLNATFDALRLDRISLVGMSFGGWLALTYASAAPQRVQKLALLSPGGFLPMVKRFSVRGMLMTFFPTPFTVNWFMRWLGLTDAPGENDARPLLGVMYRGLKHFRVPPETLHVLRSVFSDDELRALRVPVLLLFGDHERIYDPGAAMARAGRLLPDFEGELVPHCSHDMCFSQRHLVDARVLGFLNDHRARTTERVVA